MPAHPSCLTRRPLARTNRRGFAALALVAAAVIVGLAASVAFGAYQRAGQPDDATAAAVERVADQTGGGTLPPGPAGVQDVAADAVSKASIEAVAREAVALATSDGTPAQWATHLPTVAAGAGIEHSPGPDGVAGTNDDVLAHNSNRFMITIAGTVPTAVPVP